MSKIINYSSAVTLTPTGYTNTGNYAFTSNTVTNAYTDADSTNYNQMTLARNNRNTRQSQLYYEFGTSLISQIPNNATINSVAANVKYYVSSTQYVTAVSIRLYSNTTAKGSAVTNRPTSATKYSITTGSWTRSELQNARLYVSATHSASNTAAYLYFYGADLTINYTVNDTAYEVNVTNNSSASVSPSYFSGSGEDCVITFNGIESSEDIIVKDNNVDITSQLNYIAPGSRSSNLIPSSLVSNNGTVTNSQNGLTNASSNNYAQINGQDDYYMIYAFDVSSIPSNATINSVSCSAKVEHTRSSTNGQVQLYTGTTAKGSASSFGNTATTVNLTTGTWTRSELNDIRIRIGSNYTGTSQYETRFYGANLTINYAVNEAIYTYTISNISADHNIVAEDAVTTKYTVNASSTYNGATVSPSTQEVREGRNATVTVSVQNLYEINITDNGVDIENSLVGSNGTYTYSLTNVQTAHTISVTEATYYNLVASSSHDTATISPATMKVYQGQNAVFTINGNVSNLILKDNGIDVTSSISNGSYTITNVTAVHTLTVLNKPADFAKIDGSYRKVGKVFKKIEGVWVEINKTAFDDFVSTNIMMYGGDIRIEEIGSVETVGEIVNISINNNALSTGTYKLIYEDEHREPLDNVDKITEFTI